MKKVVISVNRDEKSVRTNIKIGTGRFLSHCILSHIHSTNPDTCQPATKCFYIKCKWLRACHQKVKRQAQFNRNGYEKVKPSQLRPWLTLLKQSVKNPRSFSGVLCPTPTKLMVSLWLEIYESQKDNNASFIFKQKLSLLLFYGSKSHKVFRTRRPRSDHVHEGYILGAS